MASLDDNKFDYNVAFSRNIGWFTRQEQDVLNNKRVAIAGLGGVGGHYCEALARLGVGNFTITDFDEFEIQNFNRQNASYMETVGRAKLDVIEKRILSINPNANIRTYPEGLNEDNVEEFVTGNDLYLDGLDFFVLEIREKLFATLREKGIPAITVAPIGMGAAMMTFTPDSMSFADYFGFSSVDTLAEKAVLFSTGLAPSGVHGSYIADRMALNFKEKRVPSLTIGIYLSTGVAVTNGVKILLNRGKVMKAPTSLHYDSYKNKLIKKTTFWGYRNPFQKLKVYFLKKMLGL